ncbi:MAG TPA: molybdenum cofactor biosynthesis protein MoaE [Candidatus Dormibacteraeota bacterium]|nr:molybdenum cofactor biosynthesis protein MoaE [Candidatus Dormibacteraeota bacterium]
MADEVVATRRAADAGLTRSAIDVPGLMELVSGRGDGAVATFTGIVRDNQDGRAVRHLEYEAHEPMALALMERLANQARDRFGISHAVLRHRLGRLEIGEVSVAIAVASPHRAEAIAACQWLIDTLKAEVPIFKKEFFSDGEAWVE